MDSGKYQMYIYDWALRQYFYSDTFLIGANFSSVNKIAQIESLNVFPNPIDSKFDRTFEL